jgi:hypothetical protein
MDHEDYARPFIPRLNNGVLIFRTHFRRPGYQYVFYAKSKAALMDVCDLLAWLLHNNAGVFPYVLYAFLHDYAIVCPCRLVYIHQRAPTTKPELALICAFDSLFTGLYSIFSLRPLLAPQDCVRRGEK